MTQEFTDIFGEYAYKPMGSSLNIDLSELAKATGFKQPTPTATANQIAAMLVLFWAQKTENREDDPTVSFTCKASNQSIIDRGGVSQIANTYTITIYTQNPSKLDPNNVN